jgi:prevent-host-death family protein
VETIPITEAKARIAELADRVAREHDHFTITRNGRADVMLISVAEYESMQETLDILSDEETLADLRQSREDFAAGDTFSRQARRNLHENLPLDVAVAAMETIDGPLTTNPHRAGKPLEEPFDGYHSARRGTYRIIYRINEDEQTVEIHSIRHRRDAYRT